MNTQLNIIVAAIDEANARDSTLVEADGKLHPRAFLYGKRMSTVLDKFMPDAPETLLIAARAQHIERWAIPPDKLSERSHRLSQVAQRPAAEPCKTEWRAYAGRGLWRG